MEEDRKVYHGTQCPPVPEGFDEDVVWGWIGYTNNPAHDMPKAVTTEFQDGTLGVFVEYKSGWMRLLRFFTGGGNTHCSIDWDSKKSSLGDLALRNFFD